MCIRINWMQKNKKYSGPQNFQGASICTLNLSHICINFSLIIIQMHLLIKFNTSKTIKLSSNLINWLIYLPRIFMKTYTTTLYTVLLLFMHDSLQKSVSNIVVVKCLIFHIDRWIYIHNRCQRLILSEISSAQSVLVFTK